MENISLSRVVSDDPAVLSFCELMKNYSVRHVDQSVKIKETKINSERVLTYIPSHRISAEGLWNLARKFNIDQSLKYTMTKMYYSSKNIGVCLEKNGDKNNYRIYTETHIGKSEYERAYNNLKFKIKNVDSLKWDAENPEGVKRTSYESLLYPNPKNIQLAMHMANVKYVPKVVLDKITNLGKNTFLGTYFVTDDITSRTAVDIKFHEEFMLSDLEPELTAWSKKNLKNRLEKLDIYPIHHVSLGVDADDKNYVTVYFKL